MTIEADEVLPALLDLAGVDRALLVGHSDGGTIALDYAANDPKGLQAVVTIGAHVVNEPLSVASIERAREQFLKADLRARLARYHPDDVDGAFWLWNRAWLSAGFEPMDAAGRLPRVRVPVLAVQGEHDEYGTVRQLEIIAASVAGPCRTAVIPGCGHSPHRERPDLLVEELAPFVARYARTVPDRSADGT